MTDCFPCLPPLFHPPTLTKGRQRPSTHGSKTKGHRTRNERRKRPSIFMFFNRNKAKLVALNRALLRHRRFLSPPLPRPPLLHIPTVRTESPRGRSRTTLSATRLSIRCTRVIIINIITHIITVTSDPHLHLSAHRIIHGISPKFSPIRPRPLRTACPSRRGSGRTVHSHSSSKTSSTRTPILQKRKGKSWASPLGCESAFSGIPLTGRLIDLFCLFLVTRTYQRSVSLHPTPLPPCTTLTTTSL